MTGPQRVTRPLLDLLAALLAADGEMHGWALAKATGQAAQTVYKLIDRLEDGDWLVGRWEELDAVTVRPRRRYYRLTEVGAARARDLLARRA